MAAPLRLFFPAVLAAIATSAWAEPTPPGGLNFTDGDFRLKASGYIQVDNRDYIDNSRNGASQSLLRSARPIVEAQDGKFAARFMSDFGSNQPQLLDAYADYKAMDAFNIRAGKFKVPIGLERWLPESDLLFVERAMPTNLVPYRDIGLQVYGNAIPKMLEYQLAITDGTPDLNNAGSDKDSSRDVTARLFAHPFEGMLKGLGAGVAGSYGGRNGSPTGSNLPRGFRTISQARFFTYSPGSYANGSQWRINPQALYSSGPAGLMAEYVMETQDIRSGTHSASLRNDAWMISGAYVLTGEDASFSGVQPRNTFDPAHGSWGAFEAVARYTALNVDHDAFPFFASATGSARQAHEYTAGLNWYLNYNLKFNLDYSRTDFAGGAASGRDRVSESVFLSRMQLRF